MGKATAVPRLMGCWLLGNSDDVDGHADVADYGMRLHGCEAGLVLPGFTHNKYGMV